MTESERLNRVFHALSDPSRRAILANLAAKEECSISELVEPFNMTFAAVSKHIKVLEHAELIKREINGRIHRCSADFESLRPASDFIEKYKKYWEKQFDALDEYLKKTRKKDER